MNEVSWRTWLACEGACDHTKYRTLHMHVPRSFGIVFGITGQRELSEGVELSLVYYKSSAE